MQATRQQIINILNERGKATVDELAKAVELTPMAVRHHLNVLQSDNLVDSVSVRRKSGPGRPSQIYKLTDDADALFPSDYRGLIGHLLDELNMQFGQKTVAGIFENMAQRLAQEAPPIRSNQTIEERLDETILFLHQKGFVTEWEETEANYLIHARSCPYRKVAKCHSEVCLVDKQIISTMLNSTPARTACLRSADGHCTYRLSKPIAVREPDKTMPPVQ
ncbi:ArsR family transcriptional regulator [Anaerolineales bacterium HSG6]|nr:ArsR family transcriptional regulator [Anaerolineales bacterium HSG6]MDM8531892.1 ArsR family transcriptional regulator [Anaerolineales bacterium HSG25]